MPVGSAIHVNARRLPLVKELATSDRPAVWEAMLLAPRGGMVRRGTEPLLGDVTEKTRETRSLVKCRQWLCRWAC
jgi:hypothetical protein